MSAEQSGGLPALAVRRPWLVGVLNLLILIAGIAAIMGVEVRELPNVDRPVVTVRATFPGASPETIDTEVTRLIEAAAARVSGVRQVQSSSEENTSRVTIEFRPEVDINVAANDVREAVSRAERNLPDGVEQITVIKADADAQPVLRLAITSEALSIEQLTRLVEEQIEPEITAVDGVADVTMFGNRARVMRVRLDPGRLASYGIAVDEVAGVLRMARADVPAGSFKSVDQEVRVRADASISTPAEAKALRLRDNVLLGDVADIFFSPADPTAYVRLDGGTVLSLGIVRQAQSNTVAISHGVQQVVSRLNRDMADVSITVTVDDAVFIEGAIREVLITLAIALVIVIAVVGLFMGQWRLTMVPALAIPVSLIGTVAAIWLLGFSLNLLTLLALVVASGLVVDDAIVVLENIQRRRSEGLGGLAASVLGTREVFFAVIATSATLASVFLPIAFLPSEAGRLFVEFGIVMAISVAISSFVALSLVPAIAARLPAPRPPDAAQNPVQARMNAAGKHIASGYARVLAHLLGVPWRVFGVSLAAVAVAFFLFPLIDQELVPDEDRGVVRVVLNGPDGVGLPYMDRQVEQAERVLAAAGAGDAVRYVFTITGGWDPNRGMLIVRLADWSQRQISHADLAARLRGPMSQIPGAQVRVAGGTVLGIRGADGSLNFALTGISHEAIAKAADAFELAIENQLPQLSDVRVAYRPTQPQITLDLDRQRAADLGVSVDAIRGALRALVDGDEIAELSVEDRTVPVILESTAGTVRGPQDLLSLTVRAADDHLVPLSQFVTLSEQGVAAELERHGLRRAISVSAQPAEGYTLRSAVEDVRALAERELPPGVNLLFLGEAAALEETSRDIWITFGIALLVVFLVLVAQFESLTSAAVVMITVPFALCAAVFALVLSGTSLNIYSQIGLLLLVGVMAKNGILMVEFANQLRDRGRSVADAALEAATVRLRPITMTMASTVMGATPLIIGGGPGAESRAAIGWVIFGGLGLSALFTLFLTPVVYLMLARFSKPRAHQGQRLEQELQERHAAARDKGTVRT
jgi:hydrophobic/amphiphilic exporter-1 (mainly G- bacteria), HAE1 family